MTTIREQVYDLVAAQAAQACINSTAATSIPCTQRLMAACTGRKTSLETLGMCWPAHRIRLLVSTRPEPAPVAATAMRAWLATILRSGREMAAADLVYRVNRRHGDAIEVGYFDDE